MSQVYLVPRTKQAVDADTTLSIYDSTMSIDFDCDDYGEFGVLSLRVPAEALTKLVCHSRRYLQLDAAEVRSLLEAIIKNEIEPEDLRKKSEQILSGR